MKRTLIIILAILAALVVTANIIVAVRANNDDKKSEYIKTDPYAEFDPEEFVPGISDYPEIVYEEAADSQTEPQGSDVIEPQHEGTAVPKKGANPYLDRLEEKLIDASYFDGLTGSKGGVVDNSDKFPLPESQGQQGSCTAWATTFYYKTYQEGLDHNWDAQDVSNQFSPSYVYNQINGGRDKGSYIWDAMDLLVDQGTTLLKDMKYDPRDYLTMPSNQQKELAYPHRAQEWRTIAIGDIETMKLAIETLGGVVVAMPTYTDYQEISTSNKVYDTINANDSQRGLHAICIVGYDDNLGAYKFVNSWGRKWGLDGYGYISYNLFDSFSIYEQYAYIMVDLEEADKDTTDDTRGNDTNTKDSIFYDYLNNVLIPEKGLAQETNTFESYKIDGIVSSLIYDLDGDSENEMLVVYLEKGVNQFNEETAFMNISIYEMAGNQPQLKSTIAIGNPIYGTYPKKDVIFIWNALNVFLKIHNDIPYIIVCGDFGEIWHEIYSYDGNTLNEELEMKFDQMTTESFTESYNNATAAWRESYDPDKYGVGDLGIFGNGYINIHDNELYFECLEEIISEKICTIIGRKKDGPAVGEFDTNTAVAYRDSIITITDFTGILSQN